MAKMLGPLLTTCTREHDWRAPPPGLENLLSAGIDAEELVDHACRHGIAGCVHLSLSRIGSLDADVGRLLEQAYFAGLEAHARCLQDLAIAALALDGARLPWLALKGPILSEAVYSRPDLRSYSDLDLLVEPAHIAAAVAALEAAGGQLLDRNWQLALRRMHGEVHVLMPTGTVADLHWHVLNEPTLRSSFSIDTRDLLRRAQRVAIANIEVPALADDDALIHLALHACMSGGNRLVWCKDLEQAVIRRPPDWDAVVARAAHLHTGPPTAVMLLIASRALDFAVPSEVIHQLSPGPLWRRLAVVADRVAPVETWSGGGSVARSICRTTRRDDQTSCRELARRLVSLARSGHDGGPHETDRNPDSPGSVLSPAGDRAAFFAAVERTGHGDTRT